MKKGLLVVLSWLLVSVGFSQYYFNKAVRFTNGYYSSVNQSPFNASASGITIEAWVFLEDIENDMMIVGKNFQTGYALSLRQNTATDAIVRFNMNGSFVNSTGTVSLNRWTHIAATYDNAGNTAIYIDGVNAGIAFGTLSGAIPANTDQCLIGADWFGGNPSFFFPGQLDEVRIWTGVRTAPQIASNRFIPLGVDNNSGATYNQRHGFRMNMNAATDTLFSDCWPHQPMIPHSVAVVDNSNKVSPYIDYNNHLSFDGLSVMDIQSNTAGAKLTPGTSMTVEAWVRMESGAPGSFLNIFNQSSGTNSYPWGLYAGSDGQVYFETNAGTSGSASGGDISDLRWHHVAGTCDNVAGVIKCYVDGNMVDSVTFDPSTQSIAQTTDAWYVGGIGAASFAANKFKGGIDEVRLWKNTVRTQAEIKKYMYCGLDNQVSDPDISNLVVFSLDGVSRQTNVSILKSLPDLYGSFNVGTGALFTSSKINDNTMPTSPLLRLDASQYPQDFIMDYTGKQITDLGTVWDSITVSGIGSGNISSLEVAVLLNHVYVSDVDVTLFSPDGESVELAPFDAAGCSGNDMMTIFRADADLTYSAFCTAPNNTTPSSPSVKPTQNLDLVDGNTDGIWRLRVRDNVSGLDGYWLAWGLRIKPYAGVNEQVANTFKTYNYPNPASDMTTIYYELPQNSEVTISFYDQAGRLVKQEQVNNATAGENNFAVDLTNFSAGVYYYKINAGAYQANNKMVVNK